MAERVRSVQRKSVVIEDRPGVHSQSNEASSQSELRGRTSRVVGEVWNPLRCRVLSSPHLRAGLMNAVASRLFAYVAPVPLHPVSVLEFHKTVVMCAKARFAEVLHCGRQGCTVVPEGDGIH